MTRTCGENGSASSGGRPGVCRQTVNTREDKNRRAFLRAMKGTRGVFVRKTLYVMMAVCTVAVFACGSSSKKKNVSGSTATPYVIGFLGAETGPNASPIRHNAIDLAVKDINAQGGIDGHPVKYQAYDAGVG